MGTAPQQTLSLGLDTLYKINDPKTGRLISYSDLDLGQTLPGDGKCTILADRIFINGTVGQPGLDVVLLARQIVCGPGATIDVSGGPPAVDYANSPAPNGQNGYDNADGRLNGKNAGSVTIYAATIQGSLKVLTNGGLGGSAQSGGNGAKGTTGSNWWIENSRTIHPAGNGGPGGPAGAAGTPGRGGNGGNVSIATLDGTYLTVSVSANGGDPGKPGANGQPGAPGPHGQGGSGQVLVSPGHFIGPPKAGNFAPPVFNDVSGGPGLDGPPGAAVSSNPPINAPGRVGSVAANGGSFATYATVLDPYCIAILLHESEEYYINGDLNNAIPRLVWLKGLLEACIGSQPSNPQDPYQSYRYRVDALLRQISLSLDYYGQFSNSVPLLTVEAYFQELDALFGYGKDIEAAYIAYSNAYNAKTFDQTSLTNARASLLTQNNSLKTSLDDNVTQRTAMEQNVDRLNEKLQDLWSQMAQSNENFKAAVARQSGGCDFGQVVSIGVMIGTVIATGGSASAAVGPALLALKGQQQKDGSTVPVPDTLDGFKYKVNTLVTVGKDVANFGDALNKVTQSLGKPPGPGLMTAPPDDESKILAEVHSIDAELSKYSSLPEAQAYKKLIDDYATTAQAKNNAILQVNALYTAWDATNSQINKNVVDAAGIQDHISDIQDPRVAKASAFMESSYRQARENIKFALYNVYRAYAYYSLNPANFLVDDTNMASLGAAKANITQQYYDALAAIGSAPSPFTIRVPLLPYLPGCDLESFVSGKTGLTFSIPISASEFAGVSQVMVNKIAVSFASAGGPVKNFALNLTHHGHSVMLDADGYKHVFVHQPIHIPYAVDASGVVTVSGDFSGQFSASPGGIPQYAGVSPYGPWTLDFARIDPNQRKVISDITVEFSGYVHGEAKH